MAENEVAKQIVDAAYRVHTGLGPGLLESAYEAVLAFELETRGVRVIRQQAVPIVYQGTRIDMGFRADLIVADLVIVEIKSVETVARGAGLISRKAAKPAKKTNTVLKLNTSVGLRQGAINR